MSILRKRIYISADYSEEHGDRDVVEILNKWGNDDFHLVDFVDMSHVVSGSVEADPDCRPCDLKREFNQQIHLSSIVVFIIGDKTATRTAGSICNRLNNHSGCLCTPYKQNAKGRKMCKIPFSVPANGSYVGEINRYSYLHHEFATAQKQGKQIIVLYNSSRKEEQWLPNYMKGHMLQSMPFWHFNALGQRIPNYEQFKKILGLS